MTADLDGPRLVGATQRSHRYPAWAADLGPLLGHVFQGRVLAALLFLLQDTVLFNDTLYFNTAYARHRTTLVIAHRLSSIVDATQILVLDHGRIVDRGTREELLGRDGLYAKLWALQQWEDYSGDAERTEGGRVGGGRLVGGGLE